MPSVIGVDFGTTNSVIAVRDEAGGLTTARFAVGAEAIDVFRSVLCFWTEAGQSRQAAGPAAIEAYLEDPLASRLIMSMKSYLALRSFGETRIQGRGWRLEDLIALLLRVLLAGQPAAAQLIAGRPVRFAGDAPDDALAEQRLRAAYAAVGFESIGFALEPEAAGHRFAATLDQPTTVLVGDFGGGTSDFSVLRFEPGATRRVTALGHAGIGLAGDDFDYRIIDHVVSPLLGKGDSYGVMGKRMPVPVGWYAGFARWHRLSLMRAPRTLADIATVARTADDPSRLHQLIRLIEDEAGYALYRAVSGVKAALSRADRAMLNFRHDGFLVEAEITRADFESWIAPDLARIGGAVEAALAGAGLGHGQVDRVFLTGGTSLVPAVRQLFEARFGAERLAGGGEFVSVAEGLALIGAARGATARQAADAAVP
ncbi:molecular chaperone Hsp70 [Siccirubricoccus deserti]|uniref:Hsp70 family protein n=1 Tax=Siccirubricoccus deserti TaxID=2013562 RepID=A0A9X0R346_9PROT|nr:Hsp70 family protein [Siccirubricoccus deserti]MBC4017933.1 Hsp70 family protein [Siccirubricoccus deserti]GGC62102.1 molecular chaperone Hsp70 [Siccirubricoccus deserti]